MTVASTLGKFIGVQPTEEVKLKSPFRLMAFSSPEYGAERVAIHTTKLIKGTIGALFLATQLELVNLGFTQDVNKITGKQPTGEFKRMSNKEGNLIVELQPRIVRNQYGVIVEFEIFVRPYNLATVRYMREIVKSRME